MERSSALILFFLTLLLFIALAYYGALLTFIASIVVSVFLSLILLNLFYPPSMLANDTADFSLFVYAFFQIAGLLILALYILYTSLHEVRCLA